MCGYFWVTNFLVSLSLEKYLFASFSTRGAMMRVAVIVGIAIKAKNPSIRLIIMLKEVVAPKRMLRM